MSNPILEFGESLRKPRFSFIQALLLFAIPAALLMLAQSKRRDVEIVKRIIGVQRRLSIPIVVRTPEGEREVLDFDDYAQMILSTPLPDRHGRYKECFGAARRALLTAWTEIASGQDVAHGIELGRFSAFAALDAAIEHHPDYEKKPANFKGKVWGFTGRLQSFVEHATPETLFALAKASGYTTTELRESAILDLAVVRNVTGHCKEHTPMTRTLSATVDLRPIHLASAIISALYP